MDSNHLKPVREYLESCIVGQHDLINSLLICLISDGHLLIEGMPGLAKTTAVKSLAEVIDGEYHRIQFTPDLLPSDLIGTDIFRQTQEDFEFRQGPIFHNILLCDEINRAPAKVQSALLEAMAEHQVSVGQKTYPLPELFLVLATQNPIEQDGTFNLPEAQLDRFLMHAWVDYPNREEELAILALNCHTAPETRQKPTELLSQQDLQAMREAVANVFIDEKLRNYIVDLVMASRQPELYDEDLKRWIRFGASPRATIALSRCARAQAWLDGDEFVTPDHIHRIAPNVLRHRILLTFEGEADNMSASDIVARLLAVVAIP